MGDLIWDIGSERHVNARALWVTPTFGVGTRRCCLNMRRNPDCHPGDLILSRVTPGLKPDKREAARKRLRRFARWLVRVAMDDVRERMDDDSPDAGAADTMGDMPPTL